MTIVETAPKFITLGHELIHVHHYFNGRYAGNALGSHYTINTNGGILNDIWKNGPKIEEFRTIGIGNTTPGEASKAIGVRGAYNNASDITENSIRKENGYRLRSRYTYNPDWYK